MSKPTVRSHYLPRTYLKHFLSNGELFVYMKGEKFFKKEGMTSDQRVLSVRGEEGLTNIGLEKHLYDPEIDGITSNDLEDIFNEYGERYYDQLIDEIKTIPVGADIPQEVKYRLCMFMASMRVRTPFFKNEIEQMDTSMRQHFMSRQMEQITPEGIVQFFKNEKNTEITLEFAEDVRKKILNKDYGLKYPNAFFIKFALMFLEEQADIFHQMSFSIYKSDRIFITNDNPVVYFVPKEKVNVYHSYKSLVSPYCELFCPLTKNIGLYVNWKKCAESVFSANHEMVDIFNFNLSINSFDYIISPIKMKSLNVFAEKHIPYPLKFNIS